MMTKRITSIDSLAGDQLAPEAGLARVSARSSWKDLATCEPNYRWLSALVLLTGLLSLLCEYFQISKPLVACVRALFGATTVAATGAALIIGARCAGRRSNVEMYSHIRLVSRWVYILLYVLAMSRLGLHALELRHVHAKGNSHSSVEYVRPLDDFGFYFACCVIPLWSIRAWVLMRPSQSRSGMRDLP
jgi:hypothetical protein